MNYQNKVIVITGGGNGMGWELVLNLLSKGGCVAAVDLNEAALQETATLAGDRRDRLSLHAVNITDRSAVAALPDQLIAMHGAVDCLINCAGIIQPFVRVNDLDFATIERVMNVNFYGTLNMVKAFLPHLLKRPEAHIANVSSMGGFLPVPGQTIYGASKAAVKLLTEGLHAELRNTNVKVSIIFPGAIGTNIAANSGVDAASMAEKNSGAQQRSIKPLSPKEAAEQIIAGIEAGHYQVFVGRDSRMMDLFYRISARHASGTIAKQMASLLPD